MLGRPSPDTSSYSLPTSSTSASTADRRTARSRSGPRDSGNDTPVRSRTRSRKRERSFSLTAGFTRLTAILAKLEVGGALTEAFGVEHEDDSIPFTSHAADSGGEKTVRRLHGLARERQN